MAVKVMSQNVMSWEKENVGTFSQRSPLIKRAVINNDADVVGFQEVIPFWSEYLQRELDGYDNTTVYRSEDSLEGTPVYWKRETLTALDKGCFWLSETPEVSSRGWDAKYPRTASWVLFEEKQTGKRFAFINTHLDHIGQIARINGIKLICEYIKNKFGESIPIVLVGDFNSKPDTETVATARSLLKDARDVAKITTDEGTIHHFKGANETIDYIFVSDGIICNEFKIIKEQQGESFQSDHNGLLSEIEL